jgi:polyhydroxyalkanoate synthesis regulator phasin
MKKLIASLTAAAVLGGGAITLTSWLPIGSAGAQTPTTSAPSSSTSPARGGRLKHALDGLVSKGTLTQDQEDAVLSALRDAMAGRRPALRGAIKLAADTIGVEPTDLVKDIRSGKSIADVAKANKVDPQKVIDALVKAGDARIDQALANGTIDKDKADKAKASLPGRAKHLVEFTRQAGTNGSSDSGSSGSGSSGDSGSGGTGANSVDGLFN